MSHATGKVRFEDGLIMFYEYDGTSDIALNPLFETADELDKNWRNYKIDRHGKCNCEKDEPVEIMTFYGGGYWWDGRACRHCKVITNERLICYSNVHWCDGLPYWEDENT